MNRRNPEAIEAFKEMRECLIIVEGKKDAKALNTLDLRNILSIDGKPLITIAEAVEKKRANHMYSDIIILTDFDREGRHIAARLTRLLRARKIHPNQRLRYRIMKFGFNRIEDIKMERILGIEKRRGDDYVKISSNFNKISDKSKHKSKRSCGKA